MNDSRIIDLCWKRNTDALEHKSNLYKTRLVNLAKNLLGSKENALECFNNTLLSAWNSTTSKSPSAFICVSCYNMQKYCFKQVGLGKCQDMSLQPKQNQNNPISYAKPIKTNT